jgi:hypothetical protein
MIDDDECEAVGGMIGRGNRIDRRKPAPVFRAVTVGSQRLTKEITNILVESASATLNKNTVSSSEAMLTICCLNLQKCPFSRECTDGLIDPTE